MARYHNPKTGKTVKATNLVEARKLFEKRQAKLDAKKD